LADQKNSKGEAVTLKAHGGNIDIEGMAVAVVNDKLQLERVDVWFDPMAMFRQMRPKGATDEASTEQVIASEIKVTDTEITRP
jgi:hypothetical protein